MICSFTITRDVDVGDLVYMIYLSTKIGQSKKLQKSWIGPFVVFEKLSPVLTR